MTTAIVLRLVLLLCCCSVPHLKGEAMPTDSIIEPAALNFLDGRWGTCVNGQTFQQEGLTSFGGWQYAAWFAHGGALCVGRRRLPDGAWERIRFDDYVMPDHRDAHNVAVVGVCPGDGSIHLSFDHHCDPLRYRRSLAGVATRPEAHAWTAALFGPITNQLQPGKPLAKVTYPGFLATPEGRLQLLYRLGASGDGDWHLAEYDGASGAWSDLGMIISRAGTYRHSLKRCAYPNPLRYGPDGRLHLTWCWREGVPPGNLTTNHDLQYAVSDDRGRTWRDSAGAAIALPMTVERPGLTVRETPWLWGQMNTTTQYADHQGRVHVIHWQNPAEAPAASVDLNTWRLHHYWRGTDGTWHENRLPFSGRKPQLVLDRNGVAYVALYAGPQLNYHGSETGCSLRVMRADDSGSWKRWTCIHESATASVGEPLVDYARWEAEGLLSIYSQDKPAKAGTPSALRVIDIRPE